MRVVIVILVALASLRSAGAPAQAAAVQTAASHDLSGVVTSDLGPIAGATVYIYTANVRVGTSPYCPSCYPDCRKRATTDASGAFVIPLLDPQLVFRILVVAAGYEPAFVPQVDPAMGPIKAQLKRRRLAPDAYHAIKGYILDADRKPIAGAQVSPFGIKSQKGRWWGDTSGIVDPLSITNERGEFMLVTRESDVQVDLEVRARDHAAAKFPLLASGPKAHFLQLSRGATVTGRLMHGGKPIEGAAIGLVQVNRGLEHFLGDMTISTDSDGRFTFVNVKVDENYFVYGKMDSLADQGLAASATPVKSPADGQSIDVGELLVRAGHRISGVVRLSDGAAVPANTRLLLSREHAWDSQIVGLAPDGTFTITGVPSEPVTLNVQVRGYHLSEQNVCLDPMNWHLNGIVSGDISGLVVLLDRGNAGYDTFRAKPRDEQLALRARFEEARRGPLRGFVPPPAPTTARKRR